MAGLVPAIHDLVDAVKDVDARDKRGHDAVVLGGKNAIVHQEFARAVDRGRYGHAALAADIRASAIMQVKPNSIWFDEAADLAQWQELKKKGEEPALAAYEKSKLGSRDAWQFINPLTVKVLGYQQRDNQVAVEMKTKGRFEGLKMFLDAGALAR